MTNLAEALRRTAVDHPHRNAVRLDDVALTYADLDDLTARAAGRLRESGVRPGDRVGVMLPNVPAFAVIYYGVLRAGGAVVPMNPLLKGREVEHYLGDSGARLAFAWTTGAAEAVGRCGRNRRGDRDRRRRTPSMTSPVGRRRPALPSGRTTTRR